QRSLEMNQLRSIIENKGEDAELLDPVLLQAAQRLRDMERNSTVMLTLSALMLLLISAAFALSRIKVDFRARNQVERVIQILLMISSLVAVLTTLGIII